MNLFSMEYSSIRLLRYSFLLLNNERMQSLHSMHFSARISQSILPLSKFLLLINNIDTLLFVVLIELYYVCPVSAFLRLFVVLYVRF